MDDEAAIRFSTEEQGQFEHDLRAIDTLLDELARRFRCKILKHAGKGWPGRTLRRRVGLRMFTLRLALNPDYLLDGQVFYQLNELWSVEFGEVLTKALSHIKGERLSRMEMADEARVRQLVSAALAHNLKG